MPDPLPPSLRSTLVRIEPDLRVVALGRTIHSRDDVTSAEFEKRAAGSTHVGETCIGSALYRHQGLFNDAVQRPVWSHLELSYYRDAVPAEVIAARVHARPPTGVELLRAEILLTTPASFILPSDWRGSGEHPERRTSIEYIHVQPPHLRQYRDLMRELIGPAAAKLVQERKIGTFRALETAAVLYRHPSMAVDWNQIHVCEVNPQGFEGFGRLFESAFGEAPRDGGLAGVFTRLDSVRTIPRWTFNDAAVEADGALAQLGSGCGPSGRSRP